jgi:hypothetical protein
VFRNHFLFFLLLDMWFLAACSASSIANVAIRQRDYDGFIEGEKKDLESGSKEINGDPNNSGAA